MKMDMVMAYDRVAWPYLCNIMKRMGFSKVFVDLICRYISGNWYSLILNRQRHGFSKSENDLRQGDPISPALFVISVELLSIMLNRLYDNSRFTSFHIARQGLKINHLAFADDIILFVSGKRKTLRLVRKTLEKYKIISWQQINVNKVISC